MQHYGYEFIYGENTVDTGKPADRPIPDFLGDIRDRVSDLVSPQQPIN